MRPDIEDRVINLLLTLFAVISVGLGFVGGALFMMTLRWVVA